MLCRVHCLLSPILTPWPPAPIQSCVLQPLLITSLSHGPSLAVCPLLLCCGPGTGSHPALTWGSPLLRMGYTQSLSSQCPLLTCSIRSWQPGCHLDPSQLDLTSSHLLQPEHPASAGPWPRAPCSCPTCPLLPLVFQFLGSSLLLLQVWRTKSNHALLSTLPPWQHWPFTVQAALFPHQFYPTSLQEGDSLQSQGTLPVRDGHSGGSHPSFNSPWEPSPQNQARDKPALAALCATIALRRGAGVPVESRRGFGAGWSWNIPGLFVLPR